MRKLFRSCCCSSFSIFRHTITAQSDPPLLLRFPTVSKTQIVFNYCG